MPEQIPINAMTDEEIQGLKNELPGLLAQLDTMDEEWKLAADDHRNDRKALVKRIRDTAAVIREQEAAR